VSTRVPVLVLLPVAVLCLLVGLFAGPTMPWAEDRPGEGSPEVGFARDMQVHHAQAVAMSIEALQRGSDPHLQAIALDVTTSQQAQIGTMAGWLDEWELPQRAGSQAMAWMDGHGDHPLEADGRMPGMATEQELAELRALSGEEVDLRYAQLLLVHHVGGLPMAEAVIDQSERASVVRLARSMLESQSAEVEALREIVERLGGEVPHLHGGPVSSTAHG
jgi:uncharacterized protein (DUF305 family)